jgi:hypothetical protein
MTNSAIENCVPDVPDVQSEVNKAKETAKGKVAELDFRPVDFHLDEYIGKYLSFDLITKILGKPKGLGYDMGKVTCDGDSDVFSESTFPNGAQDTIDGINGSLEGMQDQINQNAQNIDNIQIPDMGGETFSLDSAISILYNQIDSVSDVVDSAGI